ncbi:hypothetical protein SPURM210S_00409 [Streptomyces purpurascens]
MAPGAPSGTGSRFSSTTYWRTLAMGRPIGILSPAGARSITSWWVSSDVSVSP